MPAILNWLLRLLPTNPICMRLVQGGSRRLRHLYIRAGYLALMIVVLLFVLLGQVGGGNLSLRELAGAGALMFQIVSYLQVTLICLLTPVFMAGAIAQEANPRTWDILLTTPLNNLQLVLGNLFGRLFFVVALLFSSLPLFVMTQYFGGVPGESIFASYAIAGTSALLVAAIAVTLSVTRTAGRRAVFLFYISVVVYLSITYAGDLQLRKPIGVGATEEFTTILTPLNPFLALKVLLDSNRYIVHDFTGEPVTWLTRLWLGRPIATFCWLCVFASMFLVLFSTIRVRVIGAKTGVVPWYRRIMGLGAKGATERTPRSVARNPIAWRESVARGKTPVAIIGRWGFVAIGLAIGLTLLLLYHQGSLNHATMRLSVAAVLGAEIVIIALAALNMSATAVSREREDGTLDIILTTPIQPGPYIRGKHRGLFQYLIPMMTVPVITMAMIAIYVLTNGLGREGGTTMTNVPLFGTASSVDTLPVVLPEGALVLPLVLAPFIAFCVMVGLQWSIRSKGTISSVIAAVGIVLAVVGVLSLCGMPAGRNLSHLGAVMSTFSPVVSVFSIVYPENAIPSAFDDGPSTARTSLLIGACITAAGYAAISYAMHTNMKRTFMMTVRRLAGTS
ncbi:MAG: ABC transporter permease subunit [Phycisphaerales bacterium]|nr:ABC transporter permease subunit [Phycisphaerae bacterium]NNF43057.1 ABC transporter permease subunit [Phycisphaerales bacterium]NNM24844.1 ABC transporter permease subunit [Phycisphaerales bacterium]